jgi:heme-degrading monooxygenase HmoA
MFARVSEVTAPSDRMDDGIAQYRSTVLPAIVAMAGFQRAYLLVDRANGKSLSITVWDSEAAMQASEDAASQLRGQVADSIAATATASHYEVAFVEPTG